MKGFSTFLLLLLVAFSTSAHDHVLKEGFLGQLITSKLNAPTCLAIAPDGRIFVTEKGGNLRVIEDGVLQELPFVSLEVDEHGERGLGSIVLDPNFEKNGFVYVYYSVYNQNFNRLSRFKANGNLAIPGSETIIMDFDKLPGTIHNSGAMRFGVDGKLYVTTGDGVRSRNSQDSTNRLGKMVRINADGSIPVDNPFYDVTDGGNKAIYAFGLRNSFTFDLNPVTGQILANDVGLSDWEEVNEIKAGKNYGWPTTEGFKTDETVPSNYEDPFYAYSHADGKSCAIVGGAFYQPENQVFPDEYMGKYIFSDYCTGVFSVLNPMTGVVEDSIVWGAKLTSNIAVSPSGDLFFLSFTTGELWRVTYVGDGSPFISQQPNDLLRVVGEDAEFSTNVYGDNLSFQWYKNNEPIANETKSRLRLESLDLDDDGDEFYCTIKNAIGEASTRIATLEVTDNQRPTITIENPVADAKFTMGSKMDFSGKAVDPEDGLLPADQLEWKINFHHNVHYHPGLAPTGGISSGIYNIPSIGETDTNVWYRIHLKATDSEGLSNEDYLDIYPQLGAFEVQTSPKNFKVALDGNYLTTPYLKPGVVGNMRVLTAPKSQVRNDSMFKFLTWNDGEEEANREFHIEETTTFLAHYVFDKRFFDGDGEGLVGKYYANSEFEAPTKFVRVDKIIDFYWNWASPIENSQNDSCSIHWSGSILAPVSGFYTFKGDYDDGMKLQINKAIIIDDLESKSEKSSSNTIYLSEGKRYNIDLWYVERKWSSMAKLSWAYPDQAMQIIPQKFLYTSRVDELDISEDSEGALGTFPNPVQDRMFITFRSLVESLNKLEVYDSKGVMVRQIENQDNLNYYLLDTRNLKQGFYTLKAYTDRTVYKEKFLKIQSEN